MNNHEVSLEGRRILEAELLRRGASSVVWQRTRKVLLLATSADASRTVDIRVKVKRRGNWHTTIDEGRAIDGALVPQESGSFWILLDLGGSPRYWIVPEWWIRNHIYETHREYIAEHGGHRPVNDSSRHHSINEMGVAEWQDRWEVLGLF